MSEQCRSYEIPQGENPEHLDGYPIPEPTAQALNRARGVLRRTVYLAYRDDGHSSYAMLLGYHRPHTAQQKLTALSGDRTLAPRLLAFAQRQASDGGAAVINIEHDIDVEIAQVRRPGYADHYLQTTDFTCGPVAVLNALHRRDLSGAATRVQELALWREATLAVACDPYGLALAAARRGKAPEVRVSREGPVLDPAGGVGVLDEKLAEDVQRQFARQARDAGIDVNVKAFNAADIGELVDSGNIVVVLIDELSMHGEVCPHWITVTGRHQESGALLVDDPWADRQFGETAVDAYQLPIYETDLDTMIHYDQPNSAQAMLVF